VSHDERPAPDAASDDGGDAQPQIVVDDPEDFAKTRRLRAIFDARDDYVDARREANREYEHGSFGLSEKNKFIYRHMQDFAMACEPLLQSHEEGQEILNERPYGIDGSIVGKNDLASIEEAKQHLIDVANFDGGISVEKVQSLLDYLRVDIGRKAAKQIVNRSVERSKKQNQNTTDSSPVSIDQLTRGGSSGDIGKIDSGKLSALLQANQQSSSQPRVSSATVVQSVFDHFNSRRHGLHTPNHKKQFKYRARIAATDWGWSVDGLTPLINTTPTLAYPNDNKNEFKYTAPGEDVSNAVFRDLDQFLPSVGLGISFDDDQQTRITEDLLEEVDEWRRENT